jgi:hypothetical protein
MAFDNRGASKGHGKAARKAAPVAKLPRLTKKPQPNVRTLPSLSSRPNTSAKKTMAVSALPKLTKKPQPDTRRMGKLTPHPRTHITDHLPPLSDTPQTKHPFHVYPGVIGTVFAQTPAKTGGLHASMKHTNARVRKAENALTAKTQSGLSVLHVHHLPTLAHYTAAQRKAILKNAAPLKKLSLADKDRVATLARLGDTDTRRQLHKISGAAQTMENQAKERVGAAMLSGNGVKWSLSKKSGRSIARKIGVTVPTSTLTAKPAAKHAKFSGKAKVAGIPVPGLHQLGYAASASLKDLTRPGAFLLGAADAVQHPGQHPEGVLKAAAKNFKTLKVSGKDFLPANINPSVRAALGVGVDIGSDPVNLVSFGAAPVAAHSEQAARQLLHIAGEIQHTNPAHAAELTNQAHALFAKSVKLHENRGIQVRLGTPRAHIKTSGNTTAGINKLLGGSKLASTIHDHDIAQVVMRNLHAGTRPAGVDRRDWELLRSAERKARGGMRTATRLWERKGHAVNNALKGHDHRDVADAIEAVGGATIHGLPADQRAVAEYLRDVQHGMARVEHHEGLLGTPGQSLDDATRKNYLAHILSQDARKPGRKGSKRGRANEFAKQRAHEGGISEVNAKVRADMAAHGLKPHDLFEHNLGAILAERGSRHAALTHNKRFQDEVVTGLGRALPHDKSALQALHPGESMYIHGPRGLRSAGDNPRDQLKAIINLKPHSGGERLVALPTEVGDRTIRGPIAGRQIHLDERELNDLSNRYDKVIAKWKSMVTVLRAPAYQLRNLYGDLYNARLADTDPKSLADGMGVVLARGKRNRSELKDLAHPYHPSRELDMGHGRKVTVGDLIHEMETHGVIGSGFHQGDLADMRRLADGHYASFDGKRGLHPVQKLTDIGGAMEDTPRAGTYIAARRRGMTPDEATAWVAQHHFDYGDLTSFEQRALRRAFPFWTFTGRNVPLQAKKLVKRPGRYANYGMAMNGAQDQAGLPDNYVLPSSATRNFLLPVNVHGKRYLIDPRLPNEDLQKVADLKHPIDLSKDVGQMVNPIAKAIIEMSQNQSMFFRSPIYQDKEHTEAPHWVSGPTHVPFGMWDDLPKKVKVLLAGGNERAAARGLITAKAQYALTQIPQVQLLTGLATPGTPGKSSSWATGLAGYASGLKINKYDSAQRKKYNLDKKYDEVNAIDAKVRDATKLQMYGSARALRRKKAKLLDQIKKDRKDMGLPTTPTASRKKLPGALGGGSMPGSLTNSNKNPGAIG